MVTDVNNTNYGDHSIMYTIIKLLYHTFEGNMMLNGNFTSIKKNPHHTNSRFLLWLPETKKVSIENLLSGASNQTWGSEMQGWILFKSLVKQMWFFSPQNSDLYASSIRSLSYPYISSWPTYYRESFIEKILWCLVINCVEYSSFNLWHFCNKLFIIGCSCT